MSIFKVNHKINDENRIRKWLSNIPNFHHGSFRRLFLKALQRKSMSAAVRAKCQDCMNWQNAEIRQCECINCPLWRYRPGSQTKGAEELKVGSIAAKLEDELKEAVEAAA